MNRSGSGLCPDKSSFVRNKDVSREGLALSGAGTGSSITAQQTALLRLPRGHTARRVTDPRGIPSRPGPPETGCCAESIATRRLGAGKLLRRSHQSGFL